MWNSSLYCTWSLQRKRVQRIPVWCLECWSGAIRHALRNCSIQSYQYAWIVRSNHKPSMQLGLAWWDLRPCSDYAQEGPWSRPYQTTNPVWNIRWALDATDWYATIRNPSVQWKRKRQDYKWILVLQREERRRVGWSIPWVRDSYNSELRLQK